MGIQTDELSLNIHNYTLEMNRVRCHGFLLLYWNISIWQVRGQIRLSCAAVLSFGLQQFASSEFELMAEELLMSDSIIKASVMLFILFFFKFSIQVFFPFLCPNYFWLYSNVRCSYCPFLYLQIFGALRMSVKMHLMWNSKMLIEGGVDTLVQTSLLEATNLVVLRVQYKQDLDFQ